MELSLGRSSSSPVLRRSDSPFTAEVRRSLVGTARRKASTTRHSVDSAAAVLFKSRQPSASCASATTSLKEATFPPDGPQGHLPPSVRATCGARRLASAERELILLL